MCSIERILKECEAVDASESNEASRVNHPELKDAVALKAKVEAIADALKKSGKPMHNTTDPDCRHRQGRQGSHAAYNMQIVVDDKNGLIVQSDAVNDVNDRHELKNQTTQANDTLGGTCQTICADTGYDCNPDWKHLKDQGMDVVVKPTEYVTPGPLRKFVEGVCIGAYARKTEPDAPLRALILKRSEPL